MSEPSVSAETALGKFKLTGAAANFLFTLVAACASSLMVWMLYEHKMESMVSMRTASDRIEKALQDLTETQRSQLIVQREQLCLLALPPEKREAELRGTDSFCKRISR